MNVKDLKNYKDSLYSALSRDLSEFEKNFLLITGGILAFSITFIQDIVKIESATYFALLFLGWAFIGLSLGLMMFTFLSSANSSNKLWKSVDDFLINNQKFDDTQNLSAAEIHQVKTEINSILHNSKKKLRNMRHGAVIFFLLGTAFFSTFVSINILKENKKSNTQPKEIVISNGKNKELLIDISTIRLKSSDSLIILNK